MIAFLHELIYTVIMAAGAMVIFSPVLETGESGLWPVIAVIAIAAVLISFKSLGWTARFIIGGVMLTAVVAIALLNRVEIIHMFFEEHLFLLWLIPAGFTAFAAGELVAAFRPFRLIVLSALVVYVTVLTILGQTPDKFTVVSVLALALFSVVWEVQRKWDKAGYTGAKEHLVYVAPFLIITMILVYISPAPEGAYEWNFVRSMYHKAYEKIQELSVYFSPGGLYDPTENVIGFSERGEMTGSVNRKDEEVMTLSGIPSGVTSFKLTGKTFSDFDGQTWIDSDDSDSPDAMLDTLGMVASVFGRTENSRDYIRSSSINVRYLGISTAYVFAPVKPLTEGKDLQNAGLYYKGADLMWPENKAFRTEYTIPFYRLNTQNDVFADFVRSGGAPTREEFAKCAESIKAFQLPEYSYDEFLAHRDHIISLYAEPVELSDELRAYMDGVYEGSTDTYEKMERLEELLRSFEYTNAPGDLPGDIKSASDYLDYFMLSSRRGFCTHYATAFVLLARAEGVPARLAQGYLVTSVRDGMATVNSSMAHAWPEVYYDPIGWMPYEPTPGYEIRSYWRTEEEIRTMYDDATGPYADGDEENISVAEAKEEEESGIVIPWYVVVIPVAAGILVTVLFFVLANMIVSLNIKKKSPGERFIIFCRQDMYLLKQLGAGIRQGETLLEYERRTGKTGSEDAGDDPGDGEGITGTAENAGEAGPADGGKNKTHAGETAFIPYLAEYLYREDTDVVRAEEVSVEAGRKLCARLKKEYPVRYIRYLLGFRKAEDFLA